ncbi:MAG: hypothetical protein F6K41_20010 [Symploca sp. SIO3E6]|nr:hypothetical protein [Caldora sp. SIO3E6]
MPYPSRTPSENVPLWLLLLTKISFTDAVSDRLLSRKRSFAPVEKCRECDRFAQEVGALEIYANVYLVYTLE